MSGDGKNFEKCSGCGHPFPDIFKEVLSRMMHTDPPEVITRETAWCGRKCPKCGTDHYLAENLLPEFPPAGAEGHASSAPSPGDSNPEILDPRSDFIPPTAEDMAALRRVFRSLVDARGKKIAQNLVEMFTGETNPDIIEGVYHTLMDLASGGKE